MYENLPVMRVAILLTISLLSCALVPSAYAQKILTVPRFELRLGYPTRTLGTGWRAADADMKLPADGFLSMTSDPLYGIHRHELTIADGALRGAGMGSTLGMFLGAIGSTFGAWDERTAWIMTGAFAATGALMGGVKVETDDSWRYELRWDPDRR
jgi:hypothetical protein